MSDLKIKGNLLVEGGTLTVAGTQVSTPAATESLTNKSIDADQNTITNIENADIKAAAAIALDKLAATTASRALVSDASGFVSASAVTATELGYVSGVTSAIQTQLGNKIDSTEKGAANGVATLDAGGKLTNSQVPAIAITDTFVVASEVAMLALTAQTGDVAVRSDLNKSFILKGTDPTLLADWQELLTPTDAVLSVNGQTGIVSLSTTDISEGTNLYFTDERAQDAVGTILVDSSSIDLTYTDATPSITAAVIPGGVDHDQLLNFVANEHIDHTTVSIATAANTSGLTGGGDISATRNLSVDINGTTAETAADNADTILIYDNSATSLKKMTRANFLSGVPVGSTGDINETSFSAANNQAVAADVTGLAFANATVRSFKALVSVSIDATADLYEVFELVGIQKGASWDMSQTATGDTSGLVFSITNAGQVQYTSTDVAGFVSNTVKFRATTLSI